MMLDFMDYNFNITEIITACYVGPGTGQAVHNNRPSHGLALNISGKKTYNFSTGEQITTKANDIIYLPKRSSYFVSVSEPGECYAINFNIDNDIVFPPFAFKPKNIQKFTDGFNSAEKVWKKRRKAYEMKCKSELYNIIYTMQSENEFKYISNSKAKVIQPALDYIHSNYYNGNLDIKYLAEICKISETYFRRIFFNYMGLSPNKYINNLRISYAKELFKTGLYKVGEAAELSGFQCESYFCRKFKKETGITPSEFQKSYHDFKSF